MCWLFQVWGLSAMQARYSYIWNFGIMTEIYFSASKSADMLTYSHVFCRPLLPNDPGTSPLCVWLLRVSNPLVTGYKPRCLTNQYLLEMHTPSWCKVKFWSRECWLFCKPLQITFTNESLLVFCWNPHYRSLNQPLHDCSSMGKSVPTLYCMA